MRTPWRRTAPLIAVLLILTAGSSAFAQDDQKKMIAHLSDAGDQRLQNADWPAFEAAAKEAGYEAALQISQFDQAKQLSQIENVLSQGVAAFSFVPVDRIAAKPGCKLANDAGVPIVSYNDLALDCDLAAFVGRDAQEAGRAGARAALERCPTGNYALIGADPGSSVAQDMMTGWHEILDPEVEAGNIKIVSEQMNAEWKAELALAQAENALTANNDDICAMVVANDSMALAVLTTLERLPAGQVTVIGQDVELPFAQAVVEGRAAGTVWAEFGDMGRRAAETLIALDQGQELEFDRTINNGFKDVPWIEIPTYFVGADTMGEFLCTHPWWLTIEDVYANVPQDQWPTCE